MVPVAEVAAAAKVRAAIKRKVQRRIRLKAVVAHLVVAGPQRLRVNPVKRAFRAMCRSSR